MQLLTPIAPRVIPGRAIDFLNVAPSRGMSRGFACVDLSDPVFFDHPLDHVPGLLPTAAMFWRIRVEEAVLVRSSEYREFASIRRRILPGVW